MRIYGSVEYVQDKNRWAITCEPHAMIRLKGVFPRINAAEMGVVHLQNTPRACTEILWFCQLYPLAMEPAIVDRLRVGQERDREVMECTYKALTGELLPREFKLAITPRPYQSVGTELLLQRRALLITDEMGLGKTLQAVAAFTQTETLPALAVMKVGLLNQWEREAKRYLPGIRVHIIRGRKVYPLPQADVYMIGYTVLANWAETLAEIVNSVVFDEAHELRHMDTERHRSAKYAGARHVARTIEAKGGVRCALTGSPIYNYGDEMFSILDLLEEGCLGAKTEFLREHCERYGNHNRIRNTKAFGAFLLDQGLMLRRTRDDVGIQLPKRTRIIETIEPDTAVLLREKNDAIELAKKILTSRDFRASGEAARKFDMRLRQITGVAKAPAVAEYARMFLERGESIIIFAWHREVYTILEDKLRDFHPVMFTGHENAKEKEASLTAFKSGEAKLLFVSLGSSEGIDGLQGCCATVIHAELALTAQAHEQGTTRVDRPGQTRPTYEIFLVSEDGSDPTVSRMIGVKREQSDGILNPHGEVHAPLSDAQRVKALARDYLAQHGIVVKEPSDAEDEELFQEAV